jgi:acyl-CoA synthetase (NDP forming)
MGIIGSERGLNATFAPASPDPGGVSVMSQSGAFITALLDWAEDAGVGFNHVVSLGNKAVVDETDLLEHWERDPDTDVVVAYTEGLEDGDQFLETVQSVTHETPVVLLEGGRTTDGEAAAASHTGALAGGGAATADVLAQAGVFHVTSVEMLLDLAAAFAGQPVPEGDSVGIVTNAGGPGVLAADAVSEAGLTVCDLSAETRERLADGLPDAAAVGNPVDVLGDADVDRFERAIDVTLADNRTDAAVVLTTPHPLVDYADLAERIVTLRTKYEKPVITCLMAGDVGSEAREILADHGIPNYFAPGRAARSLRGLLKYHEISNRRIAPAETFDVDYDLADRVIDRVQEPTLDRDSIGVEGLGLLSAYGVPIPDGGLAENPDEAVSLGERIDGPVALKAVCPDLAHKSDVGGVALDVTTEAIPDAYDQVITSVRDARPDASLDGVYVQSMSSTPEGVETIVGVHRDESFGPVVAFGLGGVFVETFDDLAFRTAPVSKREARSMIDQIEAADLLYGVRGREPVDIDGLVETIQRVSQLAVERQDIVELDINPLVATPEGVTALDLQASIRQ